MPRIPLQANPFTSAAFGSPWNDSTADVPAINEVPFRTILHALKQIQVGGKGTSIVVTGEPGSGKTHLLGRLKNGLEQDTRKGAGEVVYIYVRCKATAATLWRHVRLSMVSDLLKSGSLDRLISQRPNALEETDNLSLGRVLRCLHEGRHLHLASAWLRGESLTEADLASLQLKAGNEDEDQNRELESEHIVLALLRFISPTPAVLCFDQVEGLAAYKGDETGFHRMAQLISALNDLYDHLLLISCIVAAFEEMFDRLPNGADRDRWLQVKATLKPIAWEPASQIVRARLDASPALAAERRAHPGDAWWPINPDSLKPLFAATGLCLPRTLIQACRRQFDECMGDDLSTTEAPSPTSLADFLQEQYEKNLAEARRAVPREGADKTLGESLPWLLQNSGQTVLGPDAERSHYANLAYRGPTGDTALVFCYQRGNAFTNTLKRIDHHWNSRIGVKILSDPAIQPKQGSMGAKFLTGLKQRGAHQIYPLPEALAALHAIRNLITTALSGELTLDGRQISEQEATEWVLANLAPQVEQLKAELVQKPETGPILLPGLSALVAERKVIEVDAAARELSLLSEEVTECARRHPMHFGLLEGPPLVLFEAVEGPSPDLPDA